MLKLKNHSSDPAFNLAFEEYFTGKAADIGDSMIFFWRNRPAVIVGRFQNSFGEVNAGIAKNLGIEVIRRNTGGGAVYHDLNNLNYSFIVPAGSRDYLQDAKNSAPFDLLFDIILGLLHGLGANAEKSGRNDLLLDGRKISGAARQLTKNGLLLHGTLLFDVDLETLGRVLSADPSKYESKGLKSVKSRVCNLREVMPEEMDINDFQLALENSLDAAEYEPSRDDLAAIEKLAEEKYRKWQWNWGNSPASSLQKKQRFPWGNIELYLDVENGIISKAAIHGDFFSNGAVLVENSENAVQGVADAMTGQRHQGEELRRLLEALPLDKIFIGADPAELINFFME